MLSAPWPTLMTMSERTETSVHPRWIGEALRILFPLGEYRAADPDQLDSAQRDQVTRLATVLQEHNDERLRLQKFATMVADLGRNEHGRHEGDIDGFEPSKGNPHLRPGDTLGYSLGASWRYVVPERGLLHDPDAWRVDNRG